MSKKILKLLSLLLAAVMICSVFTACSGGGDNEPTPEPSADPSANDAPATKTFVAKVDGIEIKTNIFNYFLYDALVNVDFSDLELTGEETEEEELAARLEYLQREKEPGLTHYQDIINKALDYCLKFEVSEILAKEAGYTFTDEEIASYNESVDSTADSLLLYYGESEGCSTRDEIVYAAVGMNVNDYKLFYISQLSVSGWMEDLKTNTFTPTEEELLAYYNEHEDLYKTVTVRKLFVSYETEDEEGNALTAAQIAENKANALAKAEKYRSVILDNNLDFELFCVGFSDEVETTNRGLADITASSSLDANLVKWALDKSNDGSVPSDDIDIIEAEGGYYLVRFEGVTTYSEDSKITLSDTVSSTSIQSSVLSACKEQAYEDYITEQSKLDRFALTDKNEELMKETLDSYLSETFG